MMNFIAWFVYTVCVLGSCACSYLTFRNYLEASVVKGDKREEKRCRIELALVRAVFAMMLIFCFLWLLAYV